MMVPSMNSIDFSTLSSKAFLISQNCLSLKTSSSLEISFKWLKTDKEILKKKSNYNSLMVMTIQ